MTHHKQSKDGQIKSPLADTLLFVEHRRDGKGGFDYWIKPQDGQNTREEGRARADELALFLADHPTIGNASLIADIARSQIEKGQYGLCESGFWHGVNERFMAMAAIEHSTAAQSQAAIGKTEAESVQ